MQMSTHEVKRVGIVGTGVIGASWAAYYLARGLHVGATDPADGAEARLRRLVDEYWPALESAGLTSGASRERLTFSRTLEGAVRGAEFIQENGPERLDVKRDLIAKIDDAVSSDALIATSSSGILISSIQDAAGHPERVVLGHPFSPPHLIPLVEVVGGKLTSPDAIERALAFYEGIGKKPIHLRREAKGHVANRLQAALWREALSLVDRGVATVADIDTAISHGPGLRWALLGPFLNLEISGGSGGLTHVLEHLGPPMESWWNDLGSVQLSDELVRKVVGQVKDMLKSYSFDETVRQRDDILVKLLALKAKANQLP
jgi:3-hydroxyacyl-CoA dehydrogenase